MSDHFQYFQTVTDTETGERVAVVRKISDPATSALEFLVLTSTGKSYAQKASNLRAEDTYQMRDYMLANRFAGEACCSKCSDAAFVADVTAELGWPV